MDRPTAVELHCAAMNISGRKRPQVTMICLEHGVHEGLLVRPRWPSSRVLIDPAALASLVTMQANLPDEIDLIVTRGYEPGASSLGGLRRFSRKAGIFLFRLLYRNRGHEVDDIFGANGHDLDGTHVDISLAVNGRRIRLLPLSVFTPVSWQSRRVKKFLPLLNMVTAALVQNGFQIHRNGTESLQIHCDFVPGR